MAIEISAQGISSREMSGEILAPGAGPAHSRGASGTESRKLEQAAREFEALLLTEVLKSARQTGESGWLTSESDQGSNTALELAESQLARVLASRGILGVDKLIADNLERRGIQDAAMESDSSAGGLEAAGTPAHQPVR
jgi:Rod binding domain-containing protein